MASMICPHCGAEVQAENIYCPHCTRTLRLSVTEPQKVDQVRRTTNRTLGWVVGLGILGLCLVMAIPAFLIPGLVRNRTENAAIMGGAPPMASSPTVCISNLKQLATGALIYQSDYDDRMPNSIKFEPLLMPYIKNRAIFFCPDSGNKFGMNDKLLKVEAKTIKDPANTVYFFDANGKSIYFVHGGMAHIAFTDGHVKTVSSKVKLNLTP